MIRGWKAIAKELSVKDIRTAKKIAVGYQMPLLLIRGHVCISEDRFKKWWERLENIVFKNDGE